MVQGKSALNSRLAVIDIGGVAQIYNINIAESAEGALLNFQVKVNYSLNIKGSMGFLLVFR